MATYTQYYNLKKPESTDTSEIISDLNLNWDDIDTYLHGKVDVISSNTTLNVPSQHSTIHDALNYLKDKFIPSDVTVTIQVASGTHNYSSQITIQHPCGNQIQIVGADPVTTTITGCGSVSGSAGNWSVPLQVTDATGIAVGDYVIVKDTTGSDDHYALRGVWEVTGVAGSTVTVKNTHRESSFPSFSVTGGTVVCLKTILKFTGCSGIVAYDSVLGYLNNVAIVGDGASNTCGIVTGEAITTEIEEGIGTVICGENVGVSGFSFGYWSRFGFIFANSTAASNNNNGYYVDRVGGIVADYAIASGNTSMGFTAAYGGTISAYGATASGNQYGFRVYFSGSLFADRSVTSGNTLRGFRAGRGGAAYVANSTAIENSLDYEAIKMGYIQCPSYVGSPTFSPALNTEGNYNSIITD